MYANLCEHSETTPHHTTKDESNGKTTNWNTTICTNFLHFFTKVCAKWDKLTV